MSIRDYLLASLDIQSQAGNELVLRECIFCSKPGKMYVNLKKLKYNCFSASCSARGGIVSLIMAIEDCEMMEASQILKGNSKGLISSHTVKELEEDVESLEDDIFLEEDIQHVTPIPKGCIRVDRMTEYSPARVYLSGRGIEVDIMERFNIMACRSGRYAGRIIIPVQTLGCSTFVARDYTGKSGRKYLNPSSSLMGSVLFGYDFLPENKTVVAVEGVFDAIKLYQCGIPSVAYFGSHLRPDQIALLSKISPSRLVLMPDADAFHSVAERIPKMMSMFPDIRIAKITEKDPADMDKSDIYKAILESTILTSEMDVIDLLMEDI